MDIEDINSKFQVLCVSTMAGSAVGRDMDGQFSGIDNEKFAGPP